MEIKNDYNGQISLKSLEHFNPSVDSSLWHIQVPEKVSCNDTLFKNGFFQSGANNNVSEIPNCLTDFNCYESQGMDTVHHTSKLLMSPSYNDIRESDEFWKNIMNNEDHNILAEKYTSDYCNLISPVPDTNYFDNPESIDSSFSWNLNETQRISVNKRKIDEKMICFDSLHLNPEKILSFPNLKTKLSTCKVSRKKPRVETFNTCTHDFNNTTFIEISELEKQNERLRDSSLELVTTKDSDFAILNCNEIEKFIPTTMLNFQSSKKMHMSALNTENSIALQHTKSKSKVTNTNSLIIHADSSSLVKQKKGEEYKASSCFKRCSNSHSLNSSESKFTSDINLGFNMLYGKINLPTLNPQKTNADLHVTKANSVNAAVKYLPMPCKERSENIVSAIKNKSASSIKIDKKGSLLSLPANRLNTMMVKDILQLLGHKNERGMKELTMEYRANIVKMIQQKQLRLKQTSTSS